MANIKDTQDEFIIELTTGIKITDSTAVIKYISPSAVDSQWSATITNDAKGIINYINPIGNFLVAGTWKIWAHITRPNGKVIIGDVTKFSVKKEGI